MTHIFVISFITKNLHLNFPACINQICSARSDHSSINLLFLPFNFRHMHNASIFFNSCILPFTPLVSLNCNILYVMGIIWFGLRHLRRHQTWYEDSWYMQRKNNFLASFKPVTSSMSSKCYNWYITEKELWRKLQQVFLRKRRKVSQEGISASVQ